MITIDFFCLLQCYSPIPTIAYELKLSSSTVERALDDLQKAGFLIRESRYRARDNSSNLYTLENAALIFYKKYLLRDNSAYIPDRGEVHGEPRK